MNNIFFQILIRVIKEYDAYNKSNVEKLISHITFYRTSPSEYFINYLTLNYRGFDAELISKFRKGEKEYNNLIKDKLKNYTYNKLIKYIPKELISKKQLEYYIETRMDKSFVEDLLLSELEPKDCGPILKDIYKNIDIL